MDDRKLKFAYRMLQIALAIGCLLLAYRLYDHQRNAERGGQILSKHNQLIDSSEKLLAEVRQQREAAKEQLAKAHSRLVAAENRQAAEKSPSP